MSARPSFTVEYLEPAVEVEAEPLPDEFSPSRLRRSLVLLAAVVLAVVAVLVLVPGLGSLRGEVRGRAAGLARAGGRAAAWVVRGLRARVPGRVLPADELAYEHGDRAFRARRELGVLDRRCGRARAPSKGIKPAYSGPHSQRDEKAHG